VPHAEGDSEEYGTHAFPLQQPLGHELASQTHCPVDVLHSWPVPQAPQVAPFAPQEPLDSEAYASHVPLEVQHPLGHEVASHWQAPVLVLHSWPEGHTEHVAPLLPHDPVDSLVSASQAPPPPQHPAHAPPPQVHAPLVHESPAPHALHEAPLVPHWDDDCDA
jgi:hypothetical protein